MDIEILTIDSLAGAREEIAKVGASPVSVNIMAPKAVFTVIKITGVSATAANILKQEMLSKGGEAAVHAGVVNCRQSVSDVILMGTLNQYRRVIKSLRIQPVGLPVLAEKLKVVLKEKHG
jgi:dihydropteroate synthase